MNHEFANLSNPFETQERLPPQPRTLVELHERARKDIITRTHRLDNGFVRILLSRQKAEEFDLEKTLQDIEIAQTLKHGISEETQSLDAGGRKSGERRKGINETFMRSYSSSEQRPIIERVTAFIKPMSGEAAFTFENGKAYRIKSIVGESGRRREVRVPFLPTEHDVNAAAHVEHQLMRRAHYRKKLAQQYGLKEAELPLHETIISPRDGTEPGMQTRSEYTVSRIDALTRLHVVPLTFIKEEDGDVASVQRGLKGRLPTPEDIYGLRRLAPDHPAVKSMVRIACLDYLIGNTDRHMANFLFDPEAQTFMAIDHGLSMGYSLTTESESYDPAQDQMVKERYNGPLSGYRSIPMGLMQSRIDWELDDEAVESLSQIRDEIIQHLELEEAKRAGTLTLEQEERASQAVRDGFAAKYLSALFRFQYQNEKIAAYEADRFIERLNHLIVHRRPPRLNPGQLDFYGIDFTEKAKKKPKN